MQMHENILTFKLEMAAGTEGAVRFIDIAKCMSMVNRKLYRQNGLWQVLAARAYFQVDTVPVSATPFSVAIRGAPRSWVVRNSLVKAFEHWKDQQQKAYLASDSDIKPKWQDFKVHLSADHKAGTELTPTSGDQFGATDPYTAGEWVHSKIVYSVDDGAGALLTQEPTLHILGADTGSTAKGLIHQYGLSRRLPFDPDPSVPGNIEHSLYAISEGSLGEQVREITQNLEGENTSPPYDTDDYPGGDSNAIEPQSYAFASSPAGSVATPGPANPLVNLPRIINLNGFSSPNGLLEIQVQSQKPEANTGEFWLQLVIGDREAY